VFGIFTYLLLLFQALVAKILVIVIVYVIIILLAQNVKTLLIVSGTLIRVGTSQPSHALLMSARDHATKITFAIGPMLVMMMVRVTVLIQMKIMNVLSIRCRADASLTRDASGTMVLARHPLLLLAVLMKPSLPVQKILIVIGKVKVVVII
jgi:hypothetical protein